MRRVLVMTGSRGEWGYLRPVLELFPSYDLEPYIVATNMHVDPKFGATATEILRDGFTVQETLPMNLSASGPLKWCHELSVFAAQVAGVIERSDAELILIAGDRAESMVFASIAYYADRPICHIQAGERSGHKDGSARHAIGKLAHIHFASNDDAAERLEQFGEQPERIFTVGAPQIDDLLSDDFISSGRTIEDRGSLPPNFVLALFHSTIEDEGKLVGIVQQVHDLILEDGTHQIWILPNSDLGSEQLYNAIMDFSREKCSVYRNLRRNEFAYLLSKAVCLVGNSSSGILEAPSIGTWSVNIGSRQSDRVRSSSVLDLPFFDGEKFMEMVRGTKKGRPVREYNFGSGDAAQKICSILKSTPVTGNIVMKRVMK